MKREFIAGTLVGVRDGPTIVIEVKGQVRKFPLHCKLTVDWAYSHMDKKVTCLLEDGKVTKVE